MGITSPSGRGWLAQWPPASVPRHRMELAFQHLTNTDTSIALTLRIHIA